MALLTRLSKLAATAAALFAFPASAVATPPVTGQDPAPGGTAVQTPTGPALPKSYPAAGELVWTRVAVRTAPSPKGGAIKIFHQFRWDYRRQIMYAVGETTGSDGRPWFQVSVPMRPNGTFGWIPAILALLTAKHVLVAILVMGIGVDAKQRV